MSVKHDDDGNNKEKTQNALNLQEVSINMVCKKAKYHLGLENNSTLTTEVVYKPTTTTANLNNDNNKFKQSFQSLKPENLTTPPKDSLFLYQTAFTVNLLGFIAGIGFSWTSPVLPQLHGNQSPLLNTIINSSQESIIASILCVGAAIGPFFSGYLSENFGRKKTLIFTSIPVSLGCFILSFAYEVQHYYVGRFLYGLSSGGIFTVVVMYIGEITSENNRGKFNCINGIFIALGVLYPLAIGTLLSIKLFTLSILIFILIFLICFIFYWGPESPTYLVKINKIREAEEVLIKLRSISVEDAEFLINELRKNLENSNKDNDGGILKLFGNKGTRKAFIIAAGLLILQQFSGINAVTGFMEEIFHAASSDGNDAEKGIFSPKLAGTLIGLIQVGTVFVTSQLIDKLGRKLLLSISCLVCAMSIILLGLYFFLKNYQLPFLSSYFSWLPIACLVIYIIAFNLGLGPVPWAILSEIFPDNVKSNASAFASSLCFTISFFVTLAFPIINELLGMAQSFWIFGTCCILGAIFIKFIVIETKGKNVNEIQIILNKK